MKKTYPMAAMAAAIVLASVAAWAQQRPPAYQPPPARTQPPAVIDLQYIFKNYSLHKANKEVLKNEFQRINNEVKNERAAIRTLIERLKEDFRPGTPNYKATEEEAANREATLTVRMKILQREFAEKEAKMLYKTYQAVRQEIAEYCRATGTTMVFQCNRDPVNPADPNTIVSLVSRQVVYHAGRDISDLILKTLESRYNGPRPNPNPNPNQNQHPSVTRGGAGVRR